MIDLDRADVGQAAGRQRPRRPPSWSVAPAASGSPPLSAGLSSAVPERDDAAGVEQAAAGVGVDRGEDGAGGDVLAVAGGLLPPTSLPKMLWPLAEGDRAVDVGADGERRCVDCVAGHDAVGDVQVSPTLSYAAAWHNSV